MHRNPSINEPWKPSGAFSPIIFVTPLVMFLVALPTAAVYALANIHVPVVGVVSVVVLGGFAFVVGFAGSAMLGSGRSRNPALNVVLVLLGSVTGIYALWAMFIYFFLRHIDQPLGLFEVLFNPKGIVAIAELISENGWFTIKSSTPSGAALLSIWGLEALIFVGVSTFIGATFATLRWCEQCQTELGKDVVLEVAPGTDLAQLVRRGAFSDVERIELPTDGALVEQLHTQNCPRCAFTVAEVFEIRRTVNKKGELQEKKSTRLEPLVVSNELVLAAQKRIATAIEAQAEALAQAGPNELGELSSEPS